MTGRCYNLVPQPHFRNLFIHLNLTQYFSLLKAMTTRTKSGFMIVLKSNWEAGLTSNVWWTIMVTVGWKLVTALVGASVLGVLIRIARMIHAALAAQLPTHVVLAKVIAIQMTNVELGCDVALIIATVTLDGHPSTVLLVQQIAVKGFQFGSQRLGFLWLTPPV